MQRHVSDQVSLVSKASVALWTLIGLLLGSWGNIGRVVIQVLMSLEQLFLSEALVALVTTEWFLVGVYEQSACFGVFLGSARLAFLTACGAASPLP